MPQHSDDFRVWTVKRQARHLLRRRPGVQGQAARAGRAGLRLLVQALRRPGEQEPGLGGHRDRGLPRPERAAPARARRARSRSTTTARSRACARSTATRCASRSRSRGRASSRPRRRRPVRRGRARGGRVLRRRRPRRTRSAPARSSSRSGGAARSSRSSATPTSARCSTTPSRPPTTPRARRCSRSFKGRRLPMVDRVEISIIEEEQPRWLVVRQRRGRRRLPRRLPVRAAGDAQRQGRAEPRQARHPRLSDRRGGEPTTTCSTWTTRWSAATAPAQVALRRAIGLGIDSQQDHRLRLQRPGHGGAGRRRCRTPPPTTRS